MLFRRKHQLPLWRRVIGWLWPRTGLKRAWTYIFHRIGRLPGTTHSIAAGLASGAAVSFTPFLGLHFLLGFVLAWFTRGNMWAAAIGTVVGNPWTFPLIFALTSAIGAFLLGQDVSAYVPPLSFVTLWEDPMAYMASFIPIVFPLLIGGIPVAIFVWIVCYIGVKSAITSYRARRQARLALKMKLQESQNMGGPSI
ncbi:MAG: DUF2062 domain-containing protein [Kordiimonadaceae bacterium]|nr:DUF2062 domain-containing protein [Kordiimonadaceae bacterium]